MIRWLHTLHQKSALGFALLWIGVYCVTNSLALPLSDWIGVDSSAPLAVNLLLSGLLLWWLRRAGLFPHYGLCGIRTSPARFLWFVPLLVFVSSNLWLGCGIHRPAADIVCYILNMFCVGFLEELIFRGFLFKALAKENVKMAIAVSGVTFGLGHILNLFNGSGMGLLANVCQIVGAVACGILFVILFHRGGSLIPCIVAHALFNALSVFVDDAAVTDEKQLWFTVVTTLLAVAYTLILCKTLPKAPKET